MYTLYDNSHLNCNKVKRTVISASFRLFEIKWRNWHRFLKSCGEVSDAARRFWFPAKSVARVDEARGGTWEWTRLGSAPGGGWVVNFLSATPVTSAKVTGPFITGANRSPVSRREAVLQVFRQHRNTSDRYSRPHRLATNGRRRLPRRSCRRDARVTKSDGGTNDTPIQESFPTW